MIELPASPASACLQTAVTKSSATSNYLTYQEVILYGSYRLAAYLDIVDNPITETRRVKAERTPVRAATSVEFKEILLAATAYAPG